MERLKKHKKLGLRILVIVLSVFAIVYTAVFFYVSANKEKIIKEVTTLSGDQMGWNPGQEEEVILRIQDSGIIQIHGRELVQAAQSTVEVMDKEVLIDQQALSIEENIIQ